MYIDGFLSLDKGLAKKNATILYNMALSLFLLVMIIRQSFLCNVVKLNVELFYKLLLFFCLLLLALKECLIINHRLLFFVHLVVIIGLTLLIKSVSAFTVSVSLYFLLSSRNEDFKEIAKVAIVVTSIILALIIILSLCGIIVNYYYDENNRVREFLGFRYALYAPELYFNITALLLYLYRRRLSLIIIAIELMINQWLFEKTDSRLSYLSVLVIIFVSLLIKIPVDRFVFQYKKRLMNNVFLTFFKGMIVLSFVGCAIVSLYVIVNYSDNNPFYKKLNYKLVDRLSNGNTSYKKYGVKLLGQRIDWVGNGISIDGNKKKDDYLYVDNLYLQFLQRYGIVFFVLVICALTYSMYIIVLERNWILAFVLLMIAAHAMLDDLVLHLWYNTFWLAIPRYVFIEHKKNGKYIMIKNKDR